MLTVLQLWLGLSQTLMGVLFGAACLSLLLSLVVWAQQPPTAKPGGRPARARRRSSAAKGRVPRQLEFHAQDGSWRL